MLKKISTVLKPLPLVATMALTSVSVSAEESAAVDKIPVPVSINALMVTLIDHSAHYVWDYATFSEERALTDKEWQVVEYYSVQLAAAGPLITLGGTGQLDNTWSKDAKWIMDARSMTDAALVALNAARTKNPEELRKSGDMLVDSCENCHNHFKPNIPTEGIMHNPEYDHLYHLLGEGAAE